MRNASVSGFSFVFGVAMGYGITTYLKKSVIPERETAPKVTVITDTVVRTDTMWVGIRAPKVRKATGQAVAVTREAARVDSDSVYIPAERVVYEDSVFRAVVTGVRPRLDSLTVYPRTLTVTRSVTVPHVARWGIGVTAGVSVTPRGIAPGVAVGVTYNLVTF